MALRGTLSEPGQLARAVLVHQIRRSAARSAPAAGLALPVLMVGHPRAGDWWIAAVPAAWAFFQAGMTLDHVRRLPDRLRPLGQDGAGGGWATYGKAVGAAIGAGILAAMLLPWLVEQWVGFPLPRRLPPQPRGWLVLLVASTIAVSAGAVTLSRAIPVALDGRRAPSGGTSGLVPAELTARTHTGVAIACSGGGIRSAAFCLGGLQRLMDAGIYAKTDRVYGVSGGGYTATAMHLARRNCVVAQGEPELFASDSPEMDWLRRRSAFLVPSAAAWGRALLAMANGIVANVGMLVMTMWLVTAYGVWFLDRMPHQGVARLDRVTAQFTVSTPLRTLVVGLALSAFAWFVIAIVRLKYRRDRVPTLTPAYVPLALAAAVGAALIAIPQFVVLSHNAAVGNQPTALIASGIRAAGLVDAPVCRRALRESFVREARIAWRRTANATSATDIPFDFGACGTSGTDNAALWPTVAAPGAGRHTGPDVAVTMNAQALLDYRCPGPDENPPKGPLPAFCADSGDRTGGWANRWTGLAAIVTALLALGKSVRGNGDSDTKAGRLSTLVTRVVLPWAALIGVMALIGIIGMNMGRALTMDPARLDRPWTYAVPLAFLACVRVLNDATTSSLHPFYRERLASTFLVKRTGPTARVADPAGPVTRLGAALVAPLDPLTEATADMPRGPQRPRHEAARPQLSILCAANFNDHDYIPEERGCTTFRFETASDAAAGRAYIGITDSRLPLRDKGTRGLDEASRPLGVSPTAYGLVADPLGADTTLAVAMAASGAAFSPIVGRQQAIVRPYRILMTLGNARLGVWLPNPYYALAVSADRDLAAPSPAPGAGYTLWKRLYNKPGPYRVFKEALGQQSVTDSRIYVSDGGHFDNTGIVEALRDRPAVLFALDASADPEGSLDALSDAITTARMDLGLLITPAIGQTLDRLRPGVGGARASRGWVVLNAAYESAPEAVVCRIYFVKNVLSTVTDAELDGYARRNPEFPLTSTVNQFYGEYDFEAYRQLGWLNTNELLANTAASSAVATQG